MTSSFLKPEFFIIGERKCGTSSLYRYLLDHPCVLPCKVKEPQFFSHSLWYRWMNWKKYLALFPVIGGTEPVELDWFTLDKMGNLSKEKVEYARNVNGMELTGEASANTFAQVPPGRLHAYFPQAKPIVLLRNPTARAYSHYRMFVRFKKEGRRLPFKLTNFEQDARREMHAFSAGKRTYFIGVGVYHNRMKVWIDQFDDQGVHVIFTENLNNYESALNEMNLLCQFLSLDTHDFAEVLKIKFNESLEETMSPEIRVELDHFYEIHNESLENLLLLNLPWK